MPSIDTPLVDDATTRNMIEAVIARSAKLTVEDIALALLDARFRTFEIDMRLDAVMAGARRIRRSVELTGEPS
ncbi:hypothetical protein [Rhodopseudomonas palustris]|uniref:hypothetical protein n=1 Tax=Rhodopseudomonas palustris TaxID=1076 RepID=UPI0006421CCB|nr:hypothetical protein [Rhodopseudomonas palustris]